MARKEKKYHFIYKTTNVLSGKYYIGMHSTDNLDDGYLGSGTRLRYSINKHGKENFIREILEYCETREELKSKEIEIVNLDEIAKIECMNLIVGGCGGFISLEGAKKGRLITNERYKNELRKWSSNGGKNRIKKYGIPQQLLDNRCDWSGKSHSEETKQLMSKIKCGTGTGENNSQFGTCWVTKDGLSKKIKKEDLETNELGGWERGRK